MIEVPQIHQKNLAFEDVSAGSSLHIYTYFMIDVIGEIDVSGCPIFVDDHYTVGRVLGHMAAQRSAH